MSFAAARPGAQDGAPPWRAHLLGFTRGAVAACGAVTFTNPTEVVKTRLQLQGELAARRAPPGSSAAARPYGNALSAGWKILRKEGLAGIQRGLLPAYGHQVLLNGSRFMLYDPLKVFFAGVLPAGPLVNVAAGGLCGVVGSAVSSPFFLVKTDIAVGHQHDYVTRGTIASFRTILKAEGVRGLWRGADAVMLRTGVGSAIQLSCYDKMKALVLDAFGGNETPAVHFLASIATGLVVCAGMNPLDLVTTRLYNQPRGPDGRGQLYRNPADCLAKTVRAEGARGLYKGFSAQFLRVGPHTILTFVFLEQLRRIF